MILLNWEAKLFKVKTRVCQSTSSHASYVMRYECFFPNRLTCMGFLLLSKGCIPGPHDFASVSGLASHSRCVGPHEFALVPPLSPTLRALGRMNLYLSPPCLPLWVPWAAWVYTCVPLVSHSGCLARAAWVYTCPLWVPWAAWVYTCLPLVSHSGCRPHEFTLVSALSPTLGALGRMSLHLSPLVSHSGCLGQTRPERRTPLLSETHEARQMKGDKAQTRPERRTPPLRETHEGRQGTTRPERRTPPLRETNEERQGTDKTGEADTTTQGK